MFAPEDRPGNGYPAAVKAGLRTMLKCGYWLFAESRRQHGRGGYLVHFLCKGTQGFRCLMKALRLAA